MRILVIGGTRFIGFHFAEAALAAGHEVAVVHRGRSGAGLLPDATHLIADRDADLSALRGRHWDATVDLCAYYPRQVRELAAALDPGAAGRYLLVSSLSVYDVPAAPGYAEDSALLPADGPEAEEITAGTYGVLKVQCERAARQAFGPETLLVRPTYVIGPRDYTHRFDYWVERLARGGEVLAPGRPDAPLQVVDVRDLAAWMLALLERGASGAYHAATPPPFGIGDLLAAVATAVAPPGTTLTWVDEDFLRAAGVQERGLPLWPADPESRATSTADPAAALATGLALRPVADSARDIQPFERVPGTLDPEREAELLAAWHQR
ncbi:NAD-dependent epimerase/dehydratase family protein [Kitasatospora xanthocidica]|uniref:NAD-dependent epimerase/dehydratase family protein n=1 Tax=Kitasatospora xanthocidica TaxID=83382 RepID=A0A372ZJ06_9ACTN|nr:NAD-dependent epimerase/dehydratase family protein [Kitasatospora xanthocidica]RGD55534.1 NAD-dependent epimerase/dehydratase family protein [Kitasatospora xanthocidica]